MLDRRERRNESELTVWVAGGHTEPQRTVEQEETELIPDKKEYAPGETAKILVNAPFYPAEGVLTLRRDGVVSTERFTMNESSIVLQIPIEEKYLPNIHAQIDLIGAAPRIAYEDERDAKLPPRPAYASGELNLAISTASRKLSVTAEPAAKTLEPGAATAVNVAVRDARGNPVTDSEIALVAVDESILALTNYHIPNPLEVFYRQIAAGTTDYHSREKVVLANPDDLGFGSGSGNGNGDGAPPPPRVDNSGMMLRADMNADSVMAYVTKPVNNGSDNAPPIRIRSNFDALAIFAPTVRTDAEGKATVKLQLPDNLTRYRITAVAVTSSKQFGIAESNLTARQPLMVRPSAPRFMNFGDRLELPVVVQNQTDQPLTVNVAMRAANAKLPNGSGKRVIVPANDRAEVRFAVAADRSGTARFQIGATSGKLADAAEFALPVYTPATTETFATYGTTDQNGALIQPVTAPPGVYTDFGGLEITTSSTQLQELTDAFIYLQNYPYECSEQISSRVLSAAALRPVLTAFEAKDLLPPAALEAKMKADLLKLQKLQHPDGGYSFWRSDDASLPFLSVHVAHALARAVLNGYPVPAEVIAKSRLYLQNIEVKYPAAYDTQTRQAISAYALYVRDLSGDHDAAKARRLWHEAEGENLSPESLGWLLSVLGGDRDSAAETTSIKRQLLNRVTETADAANFVTAYADEGRAVLLASDRRADGVVLEALLKTDPGSELIPKLVRGLLAHKTKGRWDNTQENALILLALGRYFKVYEKSAPDFVARLWLGQTYAGEQNFSGRSIATNLISIPMNYLQQQLPGQQNLILDRQGAGQALLPDRHQLRCAEFKLARNRRRFYRHPQLRGDRRSERCHQKRRRELDD